MSILGGLGQFLGMGSWTAFRDNWVTGIGPLRKMGLWTKKPVSPDYVAGGQSGSSHVYKAATAPHQLIYGQMRVSGLQYEIGSTGANNEFMHIIIVLAGHEVDSIGNVIINNLLVSGTAVTQPEIASLARYKGSVTVVRHLGGPTQVADPGLIAAFPAWKPSHIGTGIAYVYLKLKYNAALFPNGLENIKCDVRGKKVFDPRNQTVAWTDNWALCVRDYLSSSYGYGLLDSEINDAYTIGSANTSEEIIPTAHNGSQNRYTINGTVDLSRKPLDNLRKLLTAGAGHVVPVMEGQCRIMAGAYSTPTQTIGAGDLRGDITYAPHQSIKSLFNTVLGQYAGEDSYWVKATYPQVGDQAFVQADGREIRKTIDLPYCTDHERCQRISKLVLNQHRSGATLKLPCKATVKDVAVMDVVLVDIPDLFGGAPHTFRVMDFTSNPDLTVDLMLEEDLLTDYAWQQSDATPFVPVPPDLTSGSGGVIEPGIPVRVNGLELAGQGLNTEFTGGDAHFVWRHTTAYDFQGIGQEVFGAGSGGFDAWFMGYEVTLLDTTGTVLRVDFTTDNFYDFTFLKNAYTQGGPYRAFKIEVRIKGQQNQLSQPAPLSVSNPAPALPTGLTFSAAFKSVFVQFIRPADLDFVGTEVYISTQAGFTPTPATRAYDGPDNIITLGGLVIGSTYYMRLRPYDQFGKTGLNESSEFSVTTQAIVGSDTDTTPPSTPVLSPLTTGVNQSALVVTSWVKAIWSASTDDGIVTGYFQDYWDNVNTSHRAQFTTNLDNTIIPTVPGRIYSVRVRAQDWAGNLSLWSATKTITSAGDVTAPGVVASLAVTPGLDKLIYTWINPTDANFQLVEVYVGTTPGFVANAASLKYQGNSNTFILDQVVATTGYYAKARSVSSSGVASAFTTVLGPSSPLVIGSGTMDQYFAALAIGDAYIQALDAVKITTGTLAAARIAAGSITADKLNVTTLSAIVADLGTVTAGTLTGTQIQTALSGARIVLNSAVGLSVINASGIATASITTDGGGFIGVGGAIQWDNAGNVTVPISLTTGELIGRIIRTSTTGMRAELGAVNANGRVNLIRVHNGIAEVFWVDDAGNAAFTGDISGSTGTFSGDISAASGHFTGLIDVPALSVGTAQIQDLAVDSAQIQDLAVSTLKIGVNAATSLLSKYSAGSTSTVSLILQHPADVLIVGTSFLTYLQISWIKHSTDGGATWVILRSGSLQGSVTLMSSVSVLAGTHLFLMFGSTETTVAAFASIR